MKTQTLLKSIFGVAFIAVLLLMVSCDSASNPSALVGYWLYESGSRTEDKPKNSIELFKDGTGVCDGNTISWKVENKRFIIQSSSVGIATDYNKVSNSKLTITYNDGTSATFVTKEYAEKTKEINPRDGKKYGTVKIGTQTWMAENLNYIASNSICYGDEPANCDKYGRLYSWDTAMKACPKGWHLPSNAEWQILVDFVGGDEVAGKKLKASSGWDDNGNGDDAFGFSALPGGSFDPFVRINSGKSGGYWWSATEKDFYDHFRYMGYHNEYVDNLRVLNSFGLFSVRCVQD